MNCGSGCRCGVDSPLSFSCVFISLVCEVIVFVYIRLAFSSLIECRIYTILSLVNMGGEYVRVGDFLNTLEFLSRMISFWEIGLGHIE